MAKLKFQQSSMSYNPSEIILICWFGAKETFLIVLLYIFGETMIFQDSLLIGKFKRTAFILNTATTSVVLLEFFFLFQQWNYKHWYTFQAQDAFMPQVETENYKGIFSFSIFKPLHCMKYNVATTSPNIICFSSHILIFIGLGSGWWPNCGCHKWMSGSYRSCNWRLKWIW